MSELVGSSGGMPTGGDLKLDLFDVSCHCVIIGEGTSPTPCRNWQGAVVACRQGATSNSICLM